MNKLFAHRYIIRQNLIALIGLSLCFYFTYHATQGSRSIMRLMVLNQEIATMSQNNDKLEQERIALEQKVAMMRPGSISKDLLEERARLILGYKYEDEIAIMRN